MIHLDMLRTLYGYDVWANHRILDTAEALTPAQMQTTGVASFGTIHATLVHMMAAQSLWLSRWQHPSSVHVRDTADYPDLAAIRARWREIEEETQAFIAKLGSDEEHDPARMVTYANMRGQTWSKPLWQLMLQHVNHAMQHRSEIAAMLTQFGHSPGLLDFVIYLDAPQE